MLSPEEQAELIAAVTAPVPLPPLSALKKPPRIVAAFLAAYELRPGRMASVEFSALYKLYLEWSRTYGVQRILGPNGFARYTRRNGFLPTYRYQKNGRDFWVLAMERKSALRMLEWVKHHPLTKEDRLRCAAPCRRQNKQLDAVGAK